MHLYNFECSKKPLKLRTLFNSAKLNIYTTQRKIMQSFTVLRFFVFYTQLSLSGRESEWLLSFISYVRDFPLENGYFIYTVLSVKKIHHSILFGLRFGEFLYSIVVFDTRTYLIILYCCLASLPFVNFVLCSQ